MAGGRFTLRRMTKRIALALFLTCLLAACGNKGPLVMPSPAPTEVPVQAPVEPQPEPLDAPADTPANAPQTDDGTPVRR